MGALFASLALCEGYQPATGGFLLPKAASDTDFDYFFDLCRIKRLSKQRRRRWFETPSRSLWRHCNALISASQIHLNSSPQMKWLENAWIISAHLADLKNWFWIIKHVSMSTTWKCRSYISILYNFLWAQIFFSCYSLRWVRVLSANTQTPPPPPPYPSLPLFAKTCWQNETWELSIQSHLATIMG